MNKHSKDAKATRPAKKAQLMTLVMLLLFILMVSELSYMIILNINYNDISQTSLVSSASLDYKQALAISAQNFAEASFAQAVRTLAWYESNPGIRKDNFITNSSYIIDLVVNGTIPEVQQGSPEANTIAGEMGSMTLSSYNKSLTGPASISGTIISIGETRPQVLEHNSYSISLSYTENVRMNTSGSVYTFALPVNVSIALNGSPDLLAAEKGIQRSIILADPGSLSSIIGNSYASSGSDTFAYGTIYYVPTGGSCPSISAPESYSIILATPSASTVSSCVDNFGGLVTYSLSGISVNVPYLIYPSSSDILNSLQTGREVLLNGKQLALLDISNLQHDISNNYFYTSQFAPSYLQRAEDLLASSSPQGGIFTFSGYDAQSPSFNGIGYVEVKDSPSLRVGDPYFTFSAWIYPTSESQCGGPNCIIFNKENSYEWALNQNGNLCWAIRNSIPGWNWECTTAVIPLNKWTNIELTYNGTAVAAYEDGSLVNVYKGARGTVHNTNYQNALRIGARGAPGPATSLFYGSIINVQIYNSSLNKNELSDIYSRGSAGIPISNSGLVGWWPLNGNANDYSGQGNNGTSFNLAYINMPSGPYSTLVANFTGTQQILIPEIPKYAITGSITETAWIKLNNINNMVNMPIIAPGNSNTFPLLFLQSGTSGVPAFAITGGGTEEEAIGTNPLTTGQWYFVAGVYNYITGVISLYVNGTLVGGKTVPVGTLQQQYGGGFSLGYLLSQTTYSNTQESNIQIYSSALSQSSIAALFSAGINGAPIRNSGLVGWWPLNGNANDYSGNSNGGVDGSNLNYSLYSGSAQDSVLTSGESSPVFPIPGILGCTDMQSCMNATESKLTLGVLPLSISQASMQVARFNGINSYAYIPNSNSLNFTYNTTIAAWVYPTSYPAVYATVVSKGRDYYASGYNLWILPNGELQMLINDSAQKGKSGTGLTLSGGTVPLNKWSFVAGTYNVSGSSWNIYINGKEVASYSKKRMYPIYYIYNTPLTIGTLAYSAPSYFQFNGMISNVQLYNASLTSSGIEQLYSEGITGMPLLQARVAAWYSLNGNANDYSGNNNNAESTFNVTYPYMNGEYTGTGMSRPSSIANEWQTIGLVTP